MTINTNVKCPECGAPLEITEAEKSIPVYVATSGQIETRLEARPVAACTRCEFILDLTQANPELLNQRIA